MSAWNPDVKPGDKLAVLCGSQWRRWWEVLTVERVTPTQVVCGKQRFALKDGRKVGDRWTQAQPLTGELASEIARERRADAAKTWAVMKAESAIKTLTTEQIEQVRALVERLAAGGKPEAEAA